MAISKEIGLTDVRLMLSPGHAFVVWAPKNGLQVAWETTEKTDTTIDLTNPAYQEVSSNKYDYRLLTNAEAQVIANISVAFLLAEREKITPALAIVKQSEGIFHHPIFTGLTASLTDDATLAAQYLAHAEDSIAHILVARSTSNTATAKKHYALAFSSGNFSKEVTDNIDTFRGSTSIGWYINHIQGPILRSLERLYGQWVSSSTITALGTLLPTIYIIILVVSLLPFRKRPLHK